MDYNKHINKFDNRKLLSADINKTIKMNDIETFKYLFTPRENKYNIEDVMEIKYPSMESVSGKLITRNSKENKYYLFGGIDVFKKYLNDIAEENKCFHEVILSKTPQKIKFDIDATESLIHKCFTEAMQYEEDESFFDLIKEKFESGIDPRDSNKYAEQKMSVILAEIDIAICSSFYVAYQKNVSPADIITTTSTGKLSNGEIKYSFHKFIDGFYVESNFEASQYISEFFRKFLRPEFHDVIDFDVYKTTQNFRIVYNHKENSDRVKIPFGENNPQDVARYLIQNIEGCEKLPLKIKNVDLTQKSIASINDEDVKSALKIARD